MKKARLLLFLCVFIARVSSADAVNVAVASNMSHAFSEIAELYQSTSGTKVRLSFGSSGNFARQIVQGAPYRIFLSAGSQYVDLLRSRNIELLEDIEYARGRVGVFVPHNSALSENSGLKSIIKKLFHGKYRRMVIPNPQHAPFGVAAKQSLQSAGLWVLESKRLLLAENAAQATQIAISGNVDVGIIPASHAQLPEISAKGKFYPIPEDWHQPLHQHLVLVDGASQNEAAFFAFLKEDRAQKIVKNFGYSLEINALPN